MMRYNQPQSVYARLPGDEINAVVITQNEISQRQVCFGAPDAGFSSEVQDMQYLNGSNEDSTIKELVDIRDVHVSRDLPRKKRIEEYVRQIRNPYHFRCGEITVHVSFTPNGPTLEECIAAIME